MNKHLIVFILLFLATSLLICSPITERQASRVAQNVSLERSGIEQVIGSVNYLNQDPNSYIYLVNLMPTGFVLVSADNSAQPVLGYDFKTKWSEETLPIQLKSQIDNWKKQLNYIVTNNLLADAYIRAEWQRLDVINTSFIPQRNYRDVSPLINSIWGQGDYYNAQCPSGTPVGCVATAMSQIMRYWAYPTTGQGSHSYVHPVYGTQSADFGSTTYQWSSMPISLSSSNTAVATICRQAGVSVDMDYAPDGSGAYSTDVPGALISYFKYRNTAQHHYKSSYATSTWEAMIRGELDNARPVYYDGYGPSGGHAFILDGYQGTNYFHVNWGWYGYYNGYFYLSALNPGSDTFNSNQAAVIGIQPSETYSNLSEGFEGAVFPPNNWTVTASSFSQQTTGVITGTYSARYYITATGAAASGKQLRTPKLTVNGTSAPITFKAKRATQDRGEQLKVGYSTSATGPYTYFGTTAVLTSTATTYTYAVTGITPGDYYFVIETYATTSSNAKTWVVDDVTGPTLWLDPNPLAAINMTTWAAGSIAPGNSTSSGALFQLSNTRGGTLTITSITDLSSTDFTTNINPGIALVAGQVHEFGFTYEPTNYGTDNVTFQIVTNGGTVSVTLSGSGEYNLFTDSFESYNDFSLSFAPWTQYDGDLGTTWGIQDVTFPNSGYVGSFIIFNPSATTPATAQAEAKTGAKYAACFDAVTASAPNNDWLITPYITVTTGATVKFWAKSYTADYGLERFKVRTSTTNNTYTSFTTYLAGSATAYISAPTTWTEYSYSLPNNFSGYIAIQCVSNDAFFLMIDDFVIHDNSTPPAIQLGHLEGYVYKYGTTIPIANAMVTVGTKSAYTDANGYYKIRNLIVGTHSALCSTPGAFYFNSSASGISITENNTTQQNFYLTWGELSASPTSVSLALYQSESASRTVTLSNPGGTANTAYAAYISSAATASGDRDERQLDFRMVKPNVQHISKKFKRALASTEERYTGWFGYGDINTSQYIISDNIAERGNYFVADEIGMFDGDITVSQLRHYFYNPSSAPWTTTTNKFNWKIYTVSPTGTITLAHTSAQITLPTSTPTDTELLSSYTLPTPLVITAGYDFIVTVVTTSSTGVPHSCITDVTSDNGAYYTDGWYWMGYDAVMEAYVTGASWLEGASYSGTITPGGTANLSLNFSAVDVSVGTKRANLYIYNNSNYIAPSGRGDVMVIPITLTVNVPLQTGNLNGVVREMNTNAVIEGASVTLGNRSTTTNSSGYYEFLAAPAETADLTCTKTGYPNYSESVSVPANDTRTQDVYMNWARAVPSQINFTQSQIVESIVSYPFSINNPGTDSLNWEAPSGIWGGDVMLQNPLNQDWEEADFSGWSGWLTEYSDVYYGYGYEGATGSTFVFEAEHSTEAQWLITPKLNVQSGDRFSFRYKQFNNTSEVLEVLISTTTNDTTAFGTVLANIGPMTATTWSLFDESLAAYVGMDIYVAFRYAKTNTELCYVFVDMITGPKAYMVPKGWLSCSMEQGTILPSGTENVSLDIDTNALNPGHYTAQTWIFSDGVVSPVKLYMDLTVFQLLDAEVPQNVTIDLNATTSNSFVLGWDESANAMLYKVYVSGTYETDINDFTFLTSTDQLSTTITQSQLIDAGVLGNTCFFKITADNENVSRYYVAKVSRSTTQLINRIHSVKKVKQQLKSIK